MNNLKRKLSKTGGFTLVEMLIVVAIIAILIAVSIPLVNSALEKARDATDQANERSAKAEAVLLYMGVTDLDADAVHKSGGGYIYDAVNGKLQTGDLTTAYGKCTGGHTGEYNNIGDHTKLVVGVYIDKNGNVTVGWVPTGTKGGSLSVETGTGNLKWK